MRRAKLREAREAADKTQERVAAEIDVDRTTIGKWERGESTPEAGQRTAYAHAIGVTLQELNAMLSSIPSANDETPDWLSTYLGMEQSASTLQAHEPRAIYGLFQTPAYTEAVVSTVGIDGASDSYVQRSIDQRIYRQQRVRDGHLELDVIQPEWVLHLRMGDAKTMADQLDVMAELAVLANVTIRIAPYSAGQYEALRLDNFVLMTHPWGTPRVHFEGYGGGRFISQADEVTYFALAFERATEVVLSPRDSLEFIRKEANHWRDKQ